MASEQAKKAAQRLTQKQAKAILDILNFGWADYDSLSSYECKSYGFDQNWIRKANAAMEYIRSRARGKP